MEDFIILVSKEGEEFKLTKKASILSNLITTNIQEFKETIKINLNDINSNIIIKIIHYLNHYEGTHPLNIIKPVTNNISDSCDPFSAQFIDECSFDELTDLTLASNYLDIPSLIDLSCAKLASLAIDRDPLELLKVFGLNPNEYNEEEINKIKEENKNWLKTDLDNIINQ